MEGIEQIVTSDGSHSLYVPALDETYHSRHGAVQESEHVFIRHGLRYLIQSPRAYRPLRILEIGFGTGLNALLTCKHQKEQAVHYLSLETFPLAWELVKNLNYVSEPSLAPFFQELHQAEWEKPVVVSPLFTLQKVQTSLLDFVPTPSSYDLVYFDAFAPSKQPELWTEAVMRKMYEALADGGVLVTYCAKGQLKRDLKACGFTVETLQGPPGKKEMVRAMKNS
ncbi:tRNA (5-methylaminomethyl-2-thiouridine)(34)-methyltransferase MnmD [Cytophagales bacterium LB-30]|uniref:tRNA (5-methylaminomethyl-2-thiouridine)(34)-methyltransferase MnmD n=1 Tax=Shiella aurantiaca TaxID=3058365 RepID=A0ABT8F6Y7_9BACT|nr:tRNA (5-methylaminomethyl-2-thiouridine)(34)-methyltransferase MnmD [Shiella aurantiaca]MDN4166237.1 tRNA (5-methylaminomethyl-2-thiouridine)(34)-methyltransferase MnmD [Shiella aurantiaca]